MESFKNKQHTIPGEILDDLASRFLINIPEEEKSNLIRICFQIELAHWFFLDFLCNQKDTKVTSCGMRQFAVHIFEHVPFLKPHLGGVDTVLENWKQYKLSVPTYGAILISEDLKHVLLVQSFFAKSSWGFPKGKINEDETAIHCAIREVYEETGYDISSTVKERDYIELVMNYQYTRLYLVTGVKMSTKFEPKTRNEIKCCEWFPVEHLPTSKNNVEAKTQLGIGPNSFFTIIPFIKRLKKWLSDYQLRKTEEKTKQQSTNTTGGKKNRPNSNISTFYYDEPATNTAPTTTPGTFFPDNNKQGSRRSRHKSTGDVDGQFKLANFTLMEKPKTSTPKEPRRKLVFDNTQRLNYAPSAAECGVACWNGFKFDRQRLMNAVLSKLQTVPLN